MLEKPGPGQNLYTQKFRARGARAGSWLIAYTESPKNLVPGRTCILKNSGPRQDPGCWRIQKVRKAWIQAESVYSKIPGLGKLLVRSVYKQARKARAQAGSVYSNFQGLGRFLVRGVYKQTRKARALGRICILKFSGLEQAPGCWRIQKARKARVWAESVYSKIQGPGRILLAGVYRILVFFGAGQTPDLERIQTSSKSPGLGRISILKFSGPEQTPDLERIQKARKVRARAESVYSNFQDPGRILVAGVYRKLEKPGPRQDLYTQKFRARAGSCSLANTTCSKSLGQGEICILKNSGLEQVPSPGRIQKAQKIPGQGRLQID